MHFSNGTYCQENCRHKELFFFQISVWYLNRESRQNGPFNIKFTIEFKKKLSFHEPWCARVTGDIRMEQFPSVPKYSGSGKMSGISSHFSVYFLNTHRFPPNVHSHSLKLRIKMIHLNRLFLYFRFL